MTNTQRVWGVVGVLSLVVALVLAVTPITKNGIECGSALSPKPRLSVARGEDLLATAFANVDCEQARDTRRKTGIGLSLLGVGGVLYAVLKREEAPGLPAGQEPGASS